MSSVSLSRRGGHGGEIYFAPRTGSNDTAAVAAAAPHPAVQSSEAVSSPSTATAVPIAPIDASPESSVEREEPNKVEQDAWFASDTGATDAASTMQDLFLFDDETNALLEFVGQLAASEGEVVAGVKVETLTPQEASVLRYHLVNRHRPLATASVKEMLLALQQRKVTSTEAIAAAAMFTTAMRQFVGEFVAIEESCRASQLSELAVLQSIFGSELTVYQTHPITLKTTVVLQDFDCNIELGLMLPVGYPECEPVEINSFLPPPYAGLKMPRRESGESGECGESEDDQPVETIDELLQATLTKKARELIGEDSIYACIEEAREFMQAQQHLLAAAASLEQEATTAQASKQSSLSSSSSSSPSRHVLESSTVRIFGRGRIEKFEYDAIRAVKLACDVNESQAKAMLIGERWNIDAAIVKVNAADLAVVADADTTSASIDASSSRLPPVTATPSIVRQVSLQRRADEARFAAVQAVYEPLRADPAATIACAACFDDFQLREVSGLACGHVLCWQCWRRMLHTGVRQGQSNFKCAGYKCTYQVEEGLLLAFLSNVDYSRCRQYLQNSFIQLRGWKWCINPACTKVVSIGTEDDRFTGIACSCHALWCFACGRSAHWPLSCALDVAYNESSLVQEVRAHLIEHDVTPLQVATTAAGPSTMCHLCGEFLSRHDADECYRALKKSPNPLDPNACLSCGQSWQRHADDCIVVLRIAFKQLNAKACPECGYAIEKNGGCPHMYCTQCGHDWCWSCLQEWKLHWSPSFICQPVTRPSLAASRATKTSGSLPADSAARLAALVALQRHCEREAAHVRAVRRAKLLFRTLREEETTPPAAITHSRLEDTTTAVQVSSSSAELASLQAHLGAPAHASLETVLLFIQECHAILRATHALFALHSAVGTRRLDPATPLVRRSPMAATLWSCLNQLEYFVDSLDGTLLPNGTRRTQRTLPQIEATMLAVRKYAKQLGDALRDFHRAEPPVPSDPANETAHAQALVSAVDTRELMMLLTSA